MGRPCAVSVLSVGEGKRGAAQRRRLDSLVGALHPNLAQILEVVPVAGGCAVVSERIDGPTLAVLRASRAPLRLGEVASVLSGLADGLAHLHRHGVTHGDVSPANVVMASPGRAVLVDLAGEVAFEAGTAGFRAPERARGAPAGPAGDVWSLATTGLWLVNSDDRAALEGLLSPALAAAPALRCGPDALATLARALPGRRAVELPAPASLAQGSLRARAALAETRLARVRRARGRHRRAQRWHFGHGAGSRPGSPLRPPRRSIAALAAVAAAGGLLLLRGDLSEPGREPSADVVESAPGDRPASRPVPVARLGEDGVVAVAEGLLRRRDEAVNAGDGDALTSLTVPGSPAALADAPLIAALASGSIEISGLTTDIGAVRVLAVLEDEARVEVVSRQRAHTRDAPGGGRTSVPEQAERCARLVLESHAPGSGWLLRDVCECGQAVS